MSGGRQKAVRLVRVPTVFDRRATFALKLGEILCYDHDYSTRLGNFALSELG